MKNYAHKNQGFTLIELLVVISILGLISSVALANLETAKYQAKVAAGKQFHATLQRSLGVNTIARWEFDEGAGLNAIDNSQQGLDGTITGATYVAGGISGTALSFDGDDMVKGVNFPDPGKDGQVTISAWVEPADITGVRTIVHVGNAGCTAFRVSLDGGRIYAGNNDANTLATNNRVIGNNLKQNLAVVFDKGTADAYVNGTKVGTIVNVGTTELCPSDWTIGASSGGTTGFKGIIDSFTTYSTSLTASEISKIYAQGSESRKTLVSN